MFQLGLFRGHACIAPPAAAVKLGLQARCQCSKTVASANILTYRNLAQRWSLSASTWPLAHKAPFTSASPAPARLDRVIPRRSNSPRIHNTAKSRVATKAVPQLAQDEDLYYQNSEDVRPPSVTRAVLFLVGFSALSFSGSAYYSLKQTEQIAADIRSHRDIFAELASYFTPIGTAHDAVAPEIWGSGVTEKRLLTANRQETAEKLGHGMKWLVGWCEKLGLGTSVIEFVGRTYIIAAQAYLELPSSKQVLLPIIAINTIVFAGWTVGAATRRMGPYLIKHFMHRPSSGKTYTMLSSTFSHKGGLHFLFNNMALWSIGGSALVYASVMHCGNFRIPEASRIPHFLSSFSAAGVFAAAVSHIVAAIRFRRITAIHGFQAAKATVGRQRSLGASGAVYATLVMSACAFPDAQLGIIFLPFIAVPIGYGVSALVVADVVGALSGWAIFDHWAHLGGALFGYLYYFYGTQAWEALKKQLVLRLRIGTRYTT